MEIPLHPQPLGALLGGASLPAGPGVGAPARRSSTTRSSTARTTRWTPRLPGLAGGQARASTSQSLARVSTTPPSPRRAWCSRGLPYLRPVWGNRDWRVYRYMPGPRSARGRPWRPSARSRCAPPAPARSTSPFATPATGRPPRRAAASRAGRRAHPRLAAARGRAGCASRPGAAGQPLRAGYAARPDLRTGRRVALTWRVCPCSPVLRKLEARLLPHGILDVLRQVALFAAAYWGYRFVRGQVDGKAAESSPNAPRADHDRARPRNLSSSRPCRRGPRAAVADRLRVLDVRQLPRHDHARRARLHLPVPQPSFYFVRNMLMVAMGIALVGYALFPTAPPRFMGEWGFVDSVSDFTGIPQDSVAVNALFNPFAAVPSMHVAFALMLGWTLARLVRRRVFKVLWFLYPFLITFVVVATANHWVIDALLGALAAGRPRRGRHTAWATAPPAPGPSGASPPAPRRRPDGRSRSQAAPGGRRPRGAVGGHARPPDRVAPDAERDLPHRLRAQRRGRGAGVAAHVLPGRDRLHRRARSGHARRALLAHVGQGNPLRRVPGLHAGPPGGGDRADRRRRLLRRARRPARGGRRGGRGAGLADGLLHARPRGGAGGGVQGGAGHPRGARGDPVRRPAVRHRRRPGRLRAAGAGGVRAGGPDRLHHRSSGSSTCAASCARARCRASRPRG